MMPWPEQSRSFAPSWSSSGGVFDLEAKRARLGELDKTIARPDVMTVVAEPGALYTRIGDLFAYACLFGLILVAVVGRLRSGPGRGPTVITSDLSLDEYKYEHD